MLELEQTDQQTNVQTNRQGKKICRVDRVLNRPRKISVLLESFRFEPSRRTVLFLDNRTKEVLFDIIGTNLLTKFHKDWKINVASREKCPAPWGHVFQPTGIIFNLVQDIIGMNLLTKFHEDWTINVASRMKNAPPLGSHVFHANVTIFKLIQDIIETNLLIF
ncbi:hypothetical protein DPMN_014677 [Dreissena polymorpha]|uniref:Uncharacterized protein n=1 Tax=Dreissena polymorpha TaxID=45954 RepID=A0A9D4NC65_DREPO|nr:hypothetical protein DPMN_014677 [Dreissena polymorpha]